MARARFKNEAEREYFRLRKNIINRNYRSRKKGRKEIMLPAIPKKITAGSIARLNKKVISYENKKARKRKSVTKKQVKKKVKPENIKPEVLSIITIMLDSVNELLDWAVNQISDTEIKAQFRAIVQKLKNDINSADEETKEKYLDRFSDMQKEFESIINKYRDTNNMVGLSKLANALNRMFNTEIKIKIDHNTLLNTATGEIEDL